MRSSDYHLLSPRGATKSFWFVTGYANRSIINHAIRQSRSMGIANRKRLNKELQCISRLLAEPCATHAGRLLSEGFDWSFFQRSQTFPKHQPPRYPRDGLWTVPECVHGPMNVLYMATTHHATARVHQAKAPLLRAIPLVDLASRDTCD